MVPWCGRLFDEATQASPDDPYDKKLQIELFQSPVYPEFLQNYFKLDEIENEKSEKKAMYCESF